MRQRLKEYIHRNGTTLKRGLVLSTVFFMITSIKSYSNYLTIIDNTNAVEKQAQKVLDEISYFNHFQLKYLNSEHAQKLLAHENNILDRGEAIISFQQPQSPASGEQNLPDTVQKPTPREERKTFFTEKLS